MVIRNVRLADEVTVGLVVCGPPGVMLLEATEENRAKEIIQQLAAGTVVAEAPIISGVGADRAAAIALRPAVEPQHIYLLADVILQRHQSLTTGKWVSAAQAAEKATERERFNLLKQAATL